MLLTSRFGQLQEGKPQLREEKATLELRDDEDDTPDLRDDDGDPDVGGAGRDSTCAVPSEDVGEADALPPLEEPQIEKKVSFKKIEEIEEEEHYRVEEDFQELVHNATTLGDPECQYWLAR